MKPTFLYTFAVGLFVFGGSARAELNAVAGCQNGRVFIMNKDSAPWLDPKIEVNGTYVFEGDAIPRWTTLRYLPGIFTKSDGTRLDLTTTACKTIDIHATINGKREHWNGAYSK